MRIPKLKVDGEEANHMLEVVYSLWAVIESER